MNHHLIQPLYSHFPGLPGLDLFPLYFFSLFLSILCISGDKIQLFHVIPRHFYPSFPLAFAWTFCPQLPSLCSFFNPVITGLVSQYLFQLNICKQCGIGYHPECRLPDYFSADGTTLKVHLTSTEQCSKYTLMYNLGQTTF